MEEVNAILITVVVDFLHYFTLVNDRAVEQNHDHQQYAFC